MSVARKVLQKWGVTAKTAFTKRYRQAMIPFLPDLTVERKITRKLRDVTPLRLQPTVTAA